MPLASHQLHRLHPDLLGDALDALEGEVALATVRGRLDRELLTLTLEDAPGGGLRLTIDQMDFTDLPSQPPTVSLWIWHDDDVAQEATVSLPEQQTRSAHNQVYRNTRWTVALPDLDQLLLDKSRSHSTDKILTLAIQGRAAPARTVMWSNEASMPMGVAVEVTVHRTMVLVTAQARRGSSARAAGQRSHLRSGKKWGLGTQPIYQLVD